MGPALARFLLAVLVLCPLLSNAALVRVDFSVAIDTDDLDRYPVFGLNGTNLPFKGSITLDTSNVPLVIPAGTIDGDDLYASDFYGYGAAAIIDMDISFGTKTWDVSAIDSIKPTPSFRAEIWFDAHLESASGPSFMWAYFTDSDSTLRLGESWAPPTQFGDTVRMVDWAWRSGSAFGSNLLIERVFIPEPRQGRIIGLTAMLIGAVTLRRRKR
ncbi:MAG TPA: hypothetical protein PLU30_18025 [Verrucomicrobiae bacterium]|nr:hypothetical protein [Verrucomicrobiae bacterium]